MLVGTDVCVRKVFVWEETGAPGANPPVWLGDHMTVSHAEGISNHFCGMVHTISDNINTKKSSPISRSQSNLSLVTQQI